MIKETWIDAWERGQYTSEQAWVVRWENGKTQRYTPYDSYGMSSFLKQGAEKGKVFINNVEVEVIPTEYGIRWKEVNNEQL